MAATRSSDAHALVQPLFRETPEPDREPGPQRRGGSGGFYALIAVLLTVTFLWHWGGILTLAVVGLVAGAVYLWTRKK